MSALSKAVREVDETIADGLRDGDNTEAYAEGHTLGRRMGYAYGLHDGHAAGYKEGHAEGRAEGRADGHRVGRAMGRMEGGASARADTLLRVLEHRAWPISAPLRYRVLATYDEQIFQRWFDRALTASSLEEVFEQLDA